ncbi:hypothetical protein SERLADRAFT_442059 [Serpula lacrymans var. lacrymans S7.9]|uniref:Uncharacterized protein n=1 Tax=Serpula lacrymans var. lacrymans (strain S7.9) TaxID=578457 RepID=F8P8G8_SERL9|nr:uncharacterized protein SERLADRAFT_442059 [Serpula lacrymans var. lacrymans S7.9]EGO20724.1 hypothetical protein SERLADRAFT_442059 [Serpula lacrymans var. lacrymans S7.9]
MPRNYSWLPLSTKEGFASLVGQVITKAATLKPYIIISMNAVVDGGTATLSELPSAVSSCPAQASALTPPESEDEYNWDLEDRCISKKPAIKLSSASTTSTPIKTVSTPVKSPTPNVFGYPPFFYYNTPFLPYPINYGIPGTGMPMKMEFSETGLPWSPVMPPTSSHKANHDEKQRLSSPPVEILSISDICGLYGLGESIQSGLEQLGFKVGDKLDSICNNQEFVTLAHN